MQETDSIQRFIFEHADIRGEIVHLNQSFLDITQHYPENIRPYLGQALLAAVHLTASIKFEGRISIQFQSKGALSLLLAQCDNQFNIRGMANYADDLSDEALQQSFAQGQLVLNISQNNKVQTYQSVVPIIGDNLSQSLEHYFAQSEQIATKLWFSVNETSACGMLLQLMPGQNNEQREEFWSYATKIGETITGDELKTLDNETMLHRLYHETELRLFDKQTIEFQCQCSEAKMRTGIQLLGKEEAKQLAKEQGGITITCDFCQSQYEFDIIDIELLFKGV